MEQRAVRLAGSEIHEFHTWEDLQVEKMLEEATSRWLRSREIHAILSNHHLFTVLVKPVNLPTGGTIVLFDRKRLKKFRRDGHNWEKKNDGKTVKESHKYLMVGSEERVHVYYARGLDNPGFLRRCYWLLDKERKHIALVHYRETLEVQGSPVAPPVAPVAPLVAPPAPVAPLVAPDAPSAPSAAHLATYNQANHPVCSGSAPSAAHLDTYNQANHPVCSGSGISPVSNSIQVDDSTAASIHAKKLYEINTLEWEDLF